MDFEFTGEQKKARNEMFEVCRELEKKRPSGWLIQRDRFTTDENWHYSQYCLKELARRGWLSMDWPTEYGGQERSRIYKALLYEAIGYHGIVWDSIESGLAQTLLLFGTEEHKKEFLPSMASADVSWCSLWSEPGAGSDLGNLSTTGVRKGDLYVVNGQKTWVSAGYRADWGFMLFRTDPNAPHRGLSGLSCILVNMRSPGITVRPLLMMHLKNYYNEVFFDNVQIPARNLLGKENEASRVMRGFLNTERSNVGYIAAVQRDLEGLVEYCNNTKANGEPLSRNPIIRNRLAEIACELEAGKSLSYRIMWLQDAGLVGAFEASVVKIFAGELTTRLIYLGNEILGPYGQVKSSRWAPLRGYYEAHYQSSIAMSIAGGTAEIQRNNIAWGGLGLPRMK